MKRIIFVACLLAAQGVLVARTQQELSIAITQAFDAVTPKDIEVWFSS